MSKLVLLEETEVIIEMSCQEISRKKNPKQVYLHGIAGRTYKSKDGIPLIAQLKFFFVIIPNAEE